MTAYDRFRKAHSEVAATFQKYRDARDAVAMNDRLTDEGRRRELHELVTKAGLTERLAEALRDADEAAEVAAHGVDDARAALLPPRLGADAVAAELRAQRVWARIVRTLDAEPNDSAVFQRSMSLLADADPDTRGLLLEELPDYLRSRGHDELDVSRAVDRVLSESSPEYASAVETAEWAARSASTVKSSAASLRGIIDGTSQRSDDAVLIELGGEIPQPPATATAPEQSFEQRVAEFTAAAFGNGSTD